MNFCQHKSSLTLQVSPWCELSLIIPNPKPRKSPSIFQSIENIIFRRLLLSINALGKEKAAVSLCSGDNNEEKNRDQGTLSNFSERLKFPWEVEVVRNFVENDRRLQWPKTRGDAAIQFRQLMERKLKFMEFKSWKRLALFVKYGTVFSKIYSNVFFLFLMPFLRKLVRQEFCFCISLTSGCIIVSFYTLFFGFLNAGTTVDEVIYKNSELEK